MTSGADVRAVLRYTESVREVDDYAAVEQTVRGGLAGLVGADRAVLHRLDLRGPDEVSLVWSTGALSLDRAQRLFVATGLTLASLGVVAATHTGDVGTRVRWRYAHRGRGVGGRHPHQGCRSPGREYSLRCWRRTTASTVFVPRSSPTHLYMGVRPFPVGGAPCRGPA
jgi:hypothetical protein